MMRRVADCWQPPGLFSRLRESPAAPSSGAAVSRPSQCFAVRASRVELREGQPNFGGRWDDPQPFAGDRFPTLSLSSDPVGALVEVFQDLRPDPAFRAIEAVVDTTDAPDKHGPPAIASEDIVIRRLSVVAVHRTARFAPVTESTWLAYLRDALSNELGQRGIDVLKIGYLLVGETELSQCVAGLVYDHFLTPLGSLRHQRWVRTSTISPSLSAIANVATCALRFEWSRQSNSTSVCPNWLLRWSASAFAWTANVHQRAAARFQEPKTDDHAGR